MRIEPDQNLLPHRRGGQSNGCRCDDLHDTSASAQERWRTAPNHGTIYYTGTEAPDLQSKGNTGTTGLVQ